MLVLLSVQESLDYLLSSPVLWRENLTNWQLNFFLYCILMPKKGGEFLVMLVICSALCFELQNFLSLPVSFWRIIFHLL